MEETADPGPRGGPLKSPTGASSGLGGPPQSPAKPGPRKGASSGPEGPQKIPKSPKSPAQPGPGKGSSSGLEGPPKSPKSPGGASSGLEGPQKSPATPGPGKGSSSGLEGPQTSPDGASSGPEGPLKSPIQTSPATGVSSGLEGPQKSPKSPAQTGPEKGASSSLEGPQKSLKSPDGALSGPEGPQKSPAKPGPGAGTSSGPEGPQKSPEGASSSLGGPQKILKSPSQPGPATGASSGLEGPQKSPSQPGPGTRASISLEGPQKSPSKPGPATGASSGLEGPQKSPSQPGPGTRASISLEGPQKSPSKPGPATGASSGLEGSQKSPAKPGPAKGSSSGLEGPQKSPSQPGPGTRASISLEGPQNSLKSPDRASSGPEGPQKIQKSPSQPGPGAGAQPNGGQEDPKEVQIQEDLRDPEGPQSPSGPLEEEAPLGPEDVVCDSCIESPRRALKSCLTCLVSYCREHLRPHLENPKFQSHRLLGPLRDIERRTCEGHRGPLELFCRADARCVCRECLQDEHRGHDAVPVQDARREKEKELKDKQTELLKTVTAAENAINKLQLNTVSIEHSVTEVRAVMEAQFEALRAGVDRARRGVTEVLEAEEKQALEQAEGIRAHLEHRCGELRKTQAQMDRLSRNKNDVDFLQEYCEWRKEAPDVSLPGVSIGLTDSLDSFSRAIVESTRELCAMLESAYIEKAREACRSEKMGIKTTVQAIVAAKHSLSIPDPETREDFLKYAGPLSFDPDTAHRFLRLTEDNRRLTNTTPWQHAYPDLPARFDGWRQALAAGSFYLGRHYFEVDVGGEGAHVGTHVGVTYKSIERKGRDPRGCLTGNGFSWCLQRTGRAFSAWHAGVETPLPHAAACARVGVYVDYARGLLAFYGVGRRMALLHRYQARFREPLYPAVWLPKKEDVAALVAPGEPLKSPSPPTSPADAAIMAET